MHRETKAVRVRLHELGFNDHWNVRASSGAPKGGDRTHLADPGRRGMLGHQSGSSQLRV
jgi:hypothetical protein